MTLKSIGDPVVTHSLAQLADIIWGNEILYGRIDKIGNDNKQTVMVFDSTKDVPPPVDETVRIAVVKASDPAPNASPPLCSGTVFSSAGKSGDKPGGKVDVKIYRV